MTTICGADATQNGSQIFEAAARIKGMFLEVPGTRLSIDEIGRLSGFDRPMCQVVVEALREARFLTRGRNGLFMKS
jgi:hypothetical protein